MEEWKRKYYKVKEEETPCFSLKQMDAFVEALTNEKCQTSSYDKMKQKAIAFLERGYSPVWQFESYVHKTNWELMGGIISIPLTLDSSYIFGLLPDSFHPLMIDSYHKVIKAEENKQTGFFNYIQHRGEFLVPDDVDTTSVILSSLIINKLIDTAEGRKRAEQMLDRCQRDDNGVYGCYFPVNKKQKKTLTLLDLQSMTRAHVDVGILLNFSLYLALLEMDDREELKPTLEVLVTAADQLLDVADDGKLKDNCIFYTNPFALMMMFSRFVQKSSSKNKERLEAKLKTAVKKRLFSILEKSQNSMNLGCLILAALNLNLWNDDDAKQRIWELCGKMVRQQDAFDGGFTTCYFYTWKDVGYWGSRYMSTACVIAAVEKLRSDIATHEMAILFDDMSCNK